MSDEKKKPFVPKTPMDFQKLKLDKLMANPDKPVVIPEMPKEKKGLSVPEFVRNVMGSSAGAGSGEFHVYRHLRRKEYTRQKLIDGKAETDRLDDEFHNRVKQNQQKMEERTAKKRAKRTKRKERLKKLKISKKLNKDENPIQAKKESSSEEELSDEDSKTESNATDEINNAPESGQNVS